MLRLTCGVCGDVLLQLCMMGDGALRGDRRIKVPFRRDEIREAGFPMGNTYLDYNKVFRRERVHVEHTIGIIRRHRFVRSPFYFLFWFRIDRVRAVRS